MARDRIACPTFLSILGFGLSWIYTDLYFVHAGKTAVSSYVSAMSEDTVSL